jgi:hypothetical protein
MITMMKKSKFTVALLTVLLSLPAYGESMGKSVKIAAGAEADGASSVNGSVSIGENAVVTGDVSTVNGSIRIDAGATVAAASTVNGSVKVAENVKSNDLETVNGTISVGMGSSIDGSVEAVNGRISISNGTSVADDVSNVNGEIVLRGALVGGDVSTISGDINLFDGTMVKGDLLVEKPGKWVSDNKTSRTPRVVIGPGSEVVGIIRLERKVELFISAAAKVGGVEGEMSMHEAVRFSGKQP